MSGSGNYVNLWGGRVGIARDVCRRTDGWRNGMNMAVFWGFIAEKDKSWNHVSNFELQNTGTRTISEPHQCFFPFSKSRFFFSFPQSIPPSPAPPKNPQNFKTQFSHSIRRKTKTEKPKRPVRECTGINVLVSLLLLLLCIEEKEKKRATTPEIFDAYRAGMWKKKTFHRWIIAQWSFMLKKRKAMRCDALWNRAKGLRRGEVYVNGSFRMKWGWVWDRKEKRLHILSRW